MKLMFACSILIWSVQAEEGWHLSDISRDIFKKPADNTPKLNTMGHGSSALKCWECVNGANTTAMKAYGYDESWMCPENFVDTTRLRECRTDDDEDGFCVKNTLKGKKSFFLKRYLSLALS